MEPLEPSATNFLPFLLLVFLFSACVPNGEERNLQWTVPKIYRSADDKFLSRRSDTLFYDRKKFSGILFLVSSQGDTVQLTSYQGGLKEGKSRKWHPNGQLAEERHYWQGRKEGTQGRWWPNGKPLFESTISNDAYEGEYKAWNSAGALVKLFHYVNGQEQGAQRLWYNDGKTRANYVVDHGRRFGLLGTKNCRNVSDSIPTN
jgi:hypothetical protein